MQTKGHSYERTECEQTYYPTSFIIMVEDISDRQALSSLMNAMSELGVLISSSLGFCMFKIELVLAVNPDSFPGPPSSRKVFGLFI